MRIPPAAGANRLVRCFGCTRLTFQRRLAAGLAGRYLLWVHTPDIPSVVAEKFFGDFKGAFFKKPP